MSANTNADVAAMISRLEVVIGECLLGLASHRAAGTCREAAALLQSQQAEITRLSAMVEEWTTGGDQGVAADAIDFALNHCGPEEAQAFMFDWCANRADEWPGFVVWLARQRTRKRHAISTEQAGDFPHDVGRGIAQSQEPTP